MYAATLPTPPRLSIAFAAAVALHLAAALSLPAVQQLLRDAADRIAQRHSPAPKPLATPDVIPVRLPSSLRMTTELGAAVRDNPPSQVLLPPAAGIVRIRLDLSQSLGEAAREAQAAYERLNPTPAPVPAEVVRSVVELRLAKSRALPLATPDVGARPAAASAIVAADPAPSERRRRRAATAPSAAPEAARPRDAAPVDARREPPRETPSAAADPAPAAAAAPQAAPAVPLPTPTPTPEPAASTPAVAPPLPVPATAAQPSPAPAMVAAPAAAEPSIRPQIIYAPPSTTIYRSPSATRPAAAEAPVASEAVAGAGSSPLPERAAQPPAQPPAQPAGSAVANRAAFFQQLTQHLFTVNQRVLAEAVRASARVTVEVRFSIDRGGRVLDASALRSSGDAALDAKAVDVILRASPVPQLAPDMPQSRIELSFPVQVYQ